MARHQAQGLTPRPGARDDHPAAPAPGDPGRPRLGPLALAEFIAGDCERYSMPDPMNDTPVSIASENTRLTTALRNATLKYVYDFGNYWGAPHQGRNDARAGSELGAANLRRWGVCHAGRGLRRCAGPCGSSCRRWQTPTTPRTTRWPNGSVPTHEILRPSTASRPTNGSPGSRSERQ